MEKKYQVVEMGNGGATWRGKPTTEGRALAVALRKANLRNPKYNVSIRLGLSMHGVWKNTSSGYCICIREVETAEVPAPDPSGGRDPRKLWQAEIVLQEFCADMEAVGVIESPGTFWFPSTEGGEEQWTDLGETYAKACRVLGRKPVVRDLTGAKVRKPVHPRAGVPKEHIAVLSLTTRNCDKALTLVSARPITPERISEYLDLHTKFDLEDERQRADWCFDPVAVDLDEIEKKN